MKRTFAPTRALVLGLGLYFGVLGIAAPTDLECGEFSDPLWIDAHCDTGSGPDTTTAEAVAKRGVRVHMKVSAGVSCNAVDCQPTSCNPAIWYWDPFQLEITTLTESPSGTVTVQVCWTGGMCQVVCTSCES